MKIKPKQISTNLVKLFFETLDWTTKEPRVVDPLKFVEDGRTGKGLRGVPLQQHRHHNNHHHNL